MNDELLTDFLLEAFPNPERTGCPGEKDLEDLAQDRLPAGNETLTHVASCSECYREYRHYRRDWKTSQAGHDQVSEPAHGSTRSVPRRSLWLGIAAAVIFCASSGLLYMRTFHTTQRENDQIRSATSVEASVNLLNAVTPRGVGAEVPEATTLVTLPAAKVRLAVTLPRFSETGNYEIIVSKDRAAKETIASGSGLASQSAGQVSVHVLLDLRSAAPGTYFFTTVRESDQGTYYYPLKIAR